MHRLDALPLLVTLTYPDRFPTDKATWTEHFNRRFRRRLGLRCPGAAAIWRKEFKRRKTGENAGKWAPHFHLLLFAEAAPSQLYEWLPRAWYESCGRICDDHLRSGTRVEAVRSWEGAKRYVAKRPGEVEQLEESVPPTWPVLGQMERGRAPDRRAARPALLRPRGQVAAGAWQVHRGQPSGAAPQTHDHGLLREILDYSEAADLADAIWPASTPGKAGAHQRKRPSEVRGIAGGGHGGVHVKAAYKSMHVHRRGSGPLPGSRRGRPGGVTTDRPCGRSDGRRYLVRGYGDGTLRDPGRQRSPAQAEDRPLQELDQPRPSRRACRRLRTRRGLPRAPRRSDARSGTNEEHVHQRHRRPPPRSARPPDRGGLPERASTEARLCDARGAFAKEGRQSWQGG